MKEKIKSQPNSDDLVSAIIYKAQEKRIPKSQAFFQQAFFMLKQKFPDLFEDFVFDESGPIPFSDKLDSILFRLEASAILSTLNPTYENYIITNSPEHLKKSYNKFDDILVQQIDQVADTFSELIKEQEQK